MSIECDGAQLTENDLDFCGKSDARAAPSHTFLKLIRIEKVKYYTQDEMHFV